MAPRTLQDLPAELQIEIWTYVCYLPRVFVLRDGRHTQTNVPRLHPTSLVPPAALHTCHVAREVGLRIYKRHCLNFGTIARHSFYINPAVDILYLHGERNWYHLFVTYNQLPISILAIERARYSSFRYIKWVVSKLPKLEKLIVVVNPPREILKTSITGFQSTHKVNKSYKKEFEHYEDACTLNKTSRETIRGAKTAELVHHSSPQIIVTCEEAVRADRRQDWRIRRHGVEALMKKQLDETYRMRGYM
jgi:2EXR family